MIHSPYRKEWYVGASIARGFLGLPVGRRIPTITDYAANFSCSRGVVQNALAFLEAQGAITLDKQGKRGTFLRDKNERTLFDNSGLSHLTASMPPPVNRYFAGLATGICSGMKQCSVPFTFAFQQGSQNRVQALLAGAYDFVVVSEASAGACLEAHSELEVALPFAGCRYALPYMLFLNRPDAEGLEDGMRMAIDPSSADHASISRSLCRGKDIIVEEMPFISGLYAFYTGKIDCIVFRDGIEDSSDNLLNVMMQDKNILPPDRIRRIPIPEAGQAMEQPVALVRKENYGMAGILSRYLSGPEVGAIQEKVISGEMLPRFY